MKKTPRVTIIEVAIGASILGSLLAVAIPSFAKNVHLTHYAEPIDGLARIGGSAARYAEGHPEDPLPAAAPLTPQAVPRGVKTIDGPGTWDHPTWRALDFRASPDGVPHGYSFELEKPSTTSLIARARGDLDGDGTLSSFEVRGAVGGGKLVIAPGMDVAAELE